jgi:hypothetical protein
VPLKLSYSGILFEPEAANKALADRAGRHFNDLSQMARQFAPFRADSG